MIYVSFHDLDEFLHELELENAGTTEPDTPGWGVHNVQRGIVRYTTRSAWSASDPFQVTTLTFVAGFIGGDGRLVRLEARCGSYMAAGASPSDEERYTATKQRVEQHEQALRATCDRLGLEYRNGTFELTAPTT